MSDSVHNYMYLYFIICCILLLHGPAVNESGSRAEFITLEQINQVK